MSRKAWFVVQRSFMTSITYRSEIGLWLLLDFVPIFMLLLIWSSVYVGVDQVHGYSLSQLVFYYFLTSVITNITGSHFENWRVEEIRRGKIDFYLTRPFSYLKQLFWHDIGGKLFYICVNIPVQSVVFLSLAALFKFESWQISLTTLLSFGLFLIIGYTIEYLLAMIIVLLGFWFEGAEGLEHFKWIMVTLFSGSLVPISFMPQWLKSLVEIMPFRYMYSVPISIIQNTADLSWFDGIYICAFIALLFGLTLLLWNRAKYQYASSGG